MMFRDKQGRAPASPWSAEEIDRALLRAALLQVVGMLLVWAALWLAGLYRAGDWRVTAVRAGIIVCGVLGVTFLFREPALEMVLKGLVWLVVRGITLAGVRLVPRLRVLVRWRPDWFTQGQFDGQARLALKAVFDQERPPSRDVMCRELRIFNTPARWREWAERCERKGILRPGARGGGLMRVAGMSFEEAWGRWVEPSSEWRIHPDTGELERM